MNPLRLRLLTMILGMLVCLPGLSIAPAQAADNHSVAYRLQRWRTAHFENAEDAQAYTQMLQAMLNCEVTSHSHQDHIDVTYRCPTWRTIKLTSHAEAHKWQQQLTTCGFETQHSH